MALNLAEEVMCEEDFACLLEIIEAAGVDHLVQFRTFFRSHANLLAERGLVYQRLFFARRVLIALDSLKPRAILEDKKEKKKKYMDKASIRLLREWFHCNLHHPYPSESEKKTFCHKLNISMRQVTTWFINERNRKWDRSKFPSVTKYCSDKYKRKSRLC